MVRAAFLADERFVHGFCTLLHVEMVDSDRTEGTMEIAGLAGGSATRCELGEKERDGTRLNPKFPAGEQIHL